MARVTVNEGLLEGEVVNNEYGGTFYSFKGIPYALPPFGDLRFKGPQPPKSWEGVRSAKKFGPRCFQYDYMTKTVVQGSEDCLYLNVYTPNIKPDKALPVMFWIHGGGFIFGSGEDDYYGPEFLVREDVILVTFNYRLEVLGFLCLETEDVPGNAGMKDQVEALKWVNKNISSFGGDPSNITIFGESAGGVSTSYHLISPMTKGLFKRAIVMSGTALCHWGRASKPRERALALARQLGCYTEDDKELYEFFKKQPVETLVATALPILLSERGRMAMYYSIVEEKEHDPNTRFFVGDFDSFHEGVEVMIGYTSEEGLISMGTTETVKKDLVMARDYPDFFSPKFLSFDLTANQQLELGKKIRKFYFGNRIDISNDWEQMTNFISMENFVYGTLKFTNSCAKKNKVYLYKLSCKSERNIFVDMLDLRDLVKDKPVTSHGDDLFYLFNARIVPNKIDKNSATFQLIQKVIKLWTNFAKYGNPTPDETLDAKWLNYTIQNQGFLDIGNEFIPGRAPEADEINFWDSIYEEYGQK